MKKSKNILIQEEEFLKLNAEIDSRTEDLMSQVKKLKELQLSTEKLYSDWSGTEPVTQIESIEASKEESHIEIEAQDKSSENNFALNEYLSRREDESTSEVENSNDEQKETILKKENVGRNLKLSHSAKITPSLVEAQGQESTLALGITRHKSDVKLKQRKLDNEVIPDALKGVGNEGIIRFLSAEVKLLSDQVEIMQKDEKKHLEKIKELQDYKEKSVKERDKLLHQANMTRSVLIKYEKHAENIASQLQCTQIENNNLKKELETLKREMRQNNKNHNANEIKLNRTLEEIERLKTVIQHMKQEEKEFKELQRKKTEDLSNTVKNLDRQRMELLNGFKKQLLVIDNLKRQKGLIEAGKLLKSAEDDFVNYLDCNPPEAMSSALS